ncbi:DEAD-domain-containing protein [Irpex rosettiformis]|uniref:DEAD-domain-containing protein n=1 Tax=Irpex rosettiformis TaxID=378272 RepID=A0ACB8TZG4_9APHY|nr:DEAD-domain-containing protein [Irpex rosettiformis]
MSAKLLKRKSAGPLSAAQKKTKTVHLTASDLPWKTVKSRQEAGLHSDMDGMMELEEVEGVEVVYEENAGGRVAKFKVKEEQVKESTSCVQEDNAPGSSRQGSVVQEAPEEGIPPFDSQALLPEWHTFSLHSQLFRALYARGFSSPTPIQSKAVPSATKGKDVVGVAETGSGKTLAYGLPILNWFLTEANSRRRNTRSKRPVRALVLAPTRELALQVSAHLNACLNATTVSEEIKAEEPDHGALLNAPDTQSRKLNKKGKKKAAPIEPSAGSKGLPLVSIAAIVGGMSAQKQRRILDRGVDILVATPGRLWDILQEDDDLASQIKSLRFLVLDEADRMIEAGHFAELDNILRLTLRQSEEDEIEPEFGTSDEAQDCIAKSTSIDELQTFVFSATLSKDLQRNLKKHARPKGKKGAPASTLDDLLMRLDFRDSQPDIIDLSPEGGVVSTLKQSRIDCLANEKDAFLYYFLLRYPGRTLVFLSSIDGIRRLMPLMELLEIKAFPLHSQLEQRQRLKNLDRFKSTTNSVLLATDIAARGLDIPSVDHVVHYQIPRSADVYVHRNGRTARAMRNGFSLLMCAPDERKIVKALLGSLKRSEDEIPEISVEHYLLDKLKERIQLARQIDNAQHKIKKENHEKHWLKEAAEAMEIELDSDFELSSGDERKAGPSKHQRKSRNAKTTALKAELKQLLAQPLVARGVSTRYITSGSRPIVDDVIDGTYHETMVGLKKSKAGEDVLPVKRHKTKPEQQEWTGFT